MIYQNPAAGATPAIDIPSTDDITEFFEAALPAEGYVCVAAKTPKGMAHRFFSDRRSAAAWVVDMATSRHDTYVSISTYLDPEMGRKAGNVLATQAHILDLDVGLETHKFPSKQDAVRRLIGLCAKLGVPFPTLIDSGNGLHCWWIFKTPIPLDVWRETAQLAKQVCRAENFPADPSRTADITSLLRVPWTANFKDPANPKPVCILRWRGRGTH